MYSESKLISSSTGYRVHVDFFASENPRGTILLINGAFSTVASAYQSIEFLSENFNIVAFDLPFLGKSRVHNPSNFILSKEEELEILLELIEIFQPNYAISMSWGGVSLLLALAEKPTSIRRAILGSFSPEVNEPMRAYIDEALVLLDSGDFGGNAELFNGSLGKQLPEEIKILNRRYLKRFALTAKDQMTFQMRYVLKLDVRDYMDAIAGIEIPLLFINGELDRHTTAESIRRFHIPGAPVTRKILPNTGHFLGLEGSMQGWCLHDLVAMYLAEDELVSQ